MKLRNDPYRIFQSSKTPAGLYARQKWLAEAGTQSWKSDYRQTVDALLAAPLPDGKRYADAVATITRLFGLHLTVRTCSAPIAAALKWLLDRIVLEADTLTIDLTETHPAPNLNGLPFTAGEPTLLYTGATLFLATIFARGSDPAVLASYRWVCAAENRWQADAAAGHNMLRALVVHPEFSRHPGGRGACRPADRRRGLGAAPSILSNAERTGPSGQPGGKPAARQGFRAPARAPEKRRQLGSHRAGMEHLSGGACPQKQRAVINSAIAVSAVFDIPPSGPPQRRSGLHQRPPVWRVGWILPPLGKDKSTSEHFRAHARL